MTKELQNAVTMDTFSKVSKYAKFMDMDFNTAVAYLLELRHELALTTPKEWIFFNKKESLSTSATQNETNSRKNQSACHICGYDHSIDKSAGKSAHALYLTKKIKDIQSD